MGTQCAHVGRHSGEHIGFTRGIMNVDLKATRMKMGVIKFCVCHVESGNKDGGYIYHK